MDESVQASCNCTTINMTSFVSVYNVINMTSFVSVYNVINMTSFVSVYNVINMTDYPIFDPNLILQEFEASLFLELSPLTIILTILYGLIFLVGIMGNVFVIVIIVRFKSVRTVTNYFLVNLIVGDILVIFICIPVTLGSNIYKKWIYGEILCKLTTFVQGTAVGVSVLSLLAISISRYFAIYRPLTAKIVFSTRNVRFMLVAIWMVSLVSFCPLLVVNSVHSSGLYGPFESKFCKENWRSITDKHIFNAFVFCILFAWPFLLMAIAYSVIGHTLWIGNALLMGGYEGHLNGNNIILNQRRRTVKMLICVVSLFGICWFPYYVVNMWLDFNMNKTEAVSTVYKYVYPCVMLLALSNSAVNPICYCLMSHGFRRGFDKMCCKGFLRKGSHFFLSSLKIKYTKTESILTANV